MVGVIDLTAFGHQEEALLVVLHQESHGALDKLLESDVVILLLGGGAIRVYAIGDGLAFAGQHQNLFHVLPASLEFLGIANRIARRLELGAERCRRTAVFAIKGGATIKVEAVGEHILRNLVVHTAVRLVSLEGTRRGVVDARRGHDANLLAFGLRHLRHVAERIAVRIDAKATVPGLDAGREGRAGSGGIGHVAIGGIMGGHRGDRERGEAEGLDAEFALDGRKIHLRQLHGVGAHAVSDEKEHVLWCLRKGAEGDQ